LARPRRVLRDHWHLTDGKLVGKVTVASLQIKDENLKGHLFSPDFFDAERYPRSSTSHRL